MPCDYQRFSLHLMLNSVETLRLWALPHERWEQAQRDYVSTPQLFLPPIDNRYDFNITYLFLTQGIDILITEDQFSFTAEQFRKRHNRLYITARRKIRQYRQRCNLPDLHYPSQLYTKPSKLAITKQAQREAYRARIFAKL